MTGAERSIPAKPPSPGTEGDTARASAVAGLARQVDALRRDVAALDGITDRVDDLGATVARLADTVATIAARPAPQPAPSWLVAPDDPALLARWIDELARWLHLVFLRYRDGADALPECWLYHPDVVEELVWLMHSWSAAYQGPAASAQLAGDWHDRHRPGVVRRIRGLAPSCSLDRHRTRIDWEQTPTGAVAVPGLDAVPVMARWWGLHRDEPAPEPTVPLSHGL